MRILVTGGLGFIGSSVIRNLVTKEFYKIINLDNETYAANKNSLSSFENNPQSRCLWTMAQTPDACIEGDSERRDLWSKVLKVWARVDAHHRDRLKILLFLNPLGFTDAKDGLVDEYNKEYNQYVRALLQKVICHHLKQVKGRHCFQISKGILAS